MGIHRLSRALRTYGRLGSLQGESVVIDGPGLVYRLCLSLDHKLPLNSVLSGQLPYDFLGQRVVSWLDALKARDVVVRNIYFDGYLPPRKMEVRRDRLLSQSRNHQELRDLMPLGVPHPPRVLNAAGDGVEPNLDRGACFVPAAKKPRQPFMVPAIIEHLRRSADWGPLVRVVPGEAETFCAQDVRERGGAVLTDDSDLMLDDLGTTGTVIYFRDLVDLSADQMPSMLVTKYSPHALAEEFGIADCGGLPRLAYELSTMVSGLEAALEHTRRSGSAHPNTQEDFAMFLDEHRPEQYISESHPVVPLLTTLDPRISELVIQSLTLEETGPARGNTGAPRGAERLSMFLPLMIEDHRHQSSWCMSESVRQLVYGLAQPACRNRHGAVIEYRKLESRTGGHELTVPSAEEVDEWCEDLLYTLRRFASELQEPDQRWLALAIYQDMDWTATKQNKTPLSVQSVENAVYTAAQDESKQYHAWDLIHFTAQVQASLYSFRMLQQVLNVVAELLESGALSPVTKALREELQKLPSIAEYPTVADMKDALAGFAGTNGLSVIAKVLGIPDIVLKRPGTDESDLTYAQTKEIGRTKSFRRRSRALNPYAVLSLDSDDLST